MRGTIAALLLLLLVAPTARAQDSRPQSAIDFGRYHALVIGNNNYRSLPKLRTAVTDAQGVADVLGQKYGFAVELLLNADRDQMVQAVNRYRTLGDSDNLLIYYAGHGILDEASDRGFWLPVDADKGNEARWIDVAVITGNLRAMSARHVLVIADSCYSGTLLRNAPAALGQSGDRSAWLKRMADRRARMALVSGGLEPVVDGGGSGHSVFARALINSLRENNEAMQGGELFDRLRGRVVANAQQTPAYNDIRLAGHEGGDFIFVPRTVAAPPTAATGPGSSDAQIELAFWDAVKNSTNPADYRAYLETYPQGRFAALARVRAAAASASAPAPKVAAAPPPPSPQPQRPPPVLQAVPATPAAPAPQVAAAPPSAAAGSLADAKALDREWSKVRLALRNQYDQTWRFYDNADWFESAIDYDVRKLDGETVEIELTYRAQLAVQGKPKSVRTATVRFRNQAPGYEVLDWKKR